MIEKDRRRLVFLNLGAGMGASIINLVMSFASRSIFIYFLGSVYLGLNGLFTSLLTVLSLAELGIGNSIVYFLYKPLAEKKWSTVYGLLKLYKRIYRYIGVAVFVIGMILMIFIPSFVHDEIEVNKLHVLFLLFLLNSVVSYFFTYNRSILIADQKSYFVVAVDSFMKVVVQIAQIAFLFLFKSFEIYLLLQVIATLVGNVWISRVAFKRYPEAFKGGGEASTQLLHQLRRNVVGNFANKFGDVVVNGMDNILISMFVSVTAVGLYSNYWMIVSALQSFLLSISSSVTATIGNIAVTDKDNTEGMKAFRTHQFFNFSLSYFSGVMMYAMIGPFISIWLGKSYLLGNALIGVLTLMYFVNRMRNTGNVFLDAYGLAWEQRAKPFIEAIINLTLSIVFLKFLKLGIVGVVLSTLITSFGFATFFEANIVFKNALRLPISKFMGPYFKYVGAFVLSLIVVDRLLQFLPKPIGVLWFTLRLLVSMLITVIMYVIMFHKYSEYSIVRSLIMGRILTKIRKERNG
ncbi:oligosaccharide flippase family protein [Weissella confusa]|uniref:Oligosaccharide flippase family protein n=2 Tax=Weissella confusa TaxID=1583 RepID=A0AAE2SA68_WEICO|nr:oligosaccharide flippase family protein [Weissella confusa]MBJ7633569.1 oligosaccharide flippase family protein [Weissella confusa]MBJ7646346.1 oligosaccharide flippase family protein [Weissella confusa]TGE52235.1 transporter [Weissella confusa]